jgi:hypothetical protein
MRIYIGDPACGGGTYASGVLEEMGIDPEVGFDEEEGSYYLEFFGPPELSDVLKFWGLAHEIGASRVAAIAVETLGDGDRELFRLGL